MPSRYNAAKTEPVSFCRRETLMDVETTEGNR